MKMSRFKLLQNYLPQAVLVASLLTIYLRTLAPGLTWANAGSDGGDLITAAATGGIAHPTGYPLYLLLARLFQLLPFGSLAFRTNLMSALLTTLATALVFDLVTRSILSPRNSLPWLPGLVAGYAFGLAPLIWSQAVITEVYALQTLLLLLVIYLYSIPLSFFIDKQKQLDVLRGLLLGLAMSNHVTALLLLPMALVLGSVRSRTDISEALPVRHTWFQNLKFDSPSLGRQLLGIVIGLSPYLILPLRALAHPPVNWGNPITLKNFWWLVSGQLYQSYYLQFNLPEIWRQLQAGTALFVEQFGVPGIILGLIGLIVFGRRSRLYLFTIWIAIGYAAFAFLYRSADSYVYLIPAFLCFAIWMGKSMAGLVHQFSGRAFLIIGFGFLGISYFAGRSLAFVNMVDASQDLRAESFGRETLSVAPENAILFVKGDQAVFALWYFHFALKERPDLIVIAEDLLHYDWYQETLQKTYPPLVVPGPFPWPETIARANALHTVCYAQYSDQAEMDCSKPFLAP